MNANNKGNKTVQQKDINWSNLILGNDALTQMKIKTNRELFNPIVKPDNKPFIKGFINNSCNLVFSYDEIKSISKRYAHIKFNLSNK